MIANPMRSLAERSRLSSEDKSSCGKFISSPPFVQQIYVEPSNVKLKLQDVDKFVQYS